MKGSKKCQSSSSSSLEKTEIEVTAVQKRGVKRRSKTRYVDLECTEVPALNRLVGHSLALPQKS